MARRLDLLNPHLTLTSPEPEPEPYTGLGMARLLGFLRTVGYGYGPRTVGYDFALMNNGARREAYDDLNWGVAWMRPSETSKLLLSCLLGELGLGLGQP